MCVAVIPEDTETNTGSSDPCQSDPCGTYSLRCEKHGEDFKCICFTGYTGCFNKIETIKIVTLLSNSVCSRLF